jgi:hypothetical protein
MFASIYGRKPAITVIEGTGNLPWHDFPIVTVKDIPGQTA